MHEKVSDMNTAYRPQIPGHMMATFDGRVVVTPLLRNGLVDGDKVHQLQKYTGPTPNQLAAGADTHSFYKMSNHLAS